MIAKRIVMPPIHFIISPFNPKDIRQISKDIYHIIDRYLGRPPHR